MPPPTSHKAERSGRYDERDQWPLVHEQPQDHVNRNNADRRSQNQHPMSLRLSLGDVDGNRRKGLSGTGLTSLSGDA